mmetsp:Transcript_126896/g.270597  ORF Transcript_126896/g.270597 Transcript_126896/m.270597 type:complete len:204 (-) Transcript_126896:40-651(-)
MSSAKPSSSSNLSANCFLRPVVGLGPASPGNFRVTVSSAAQAAASTLGAVAWLSSAARRSSETYWAMIFGTCSISRPVMRKCKAPQPTVCTSPDWGCKRSALTVRSTPPRSTARLRLSPPSRIRRRMMPMPKACTRSCSGCARNASSTNSKPPLSSSSMLSCTLATDSELRLDPSGAAINFAASCASSVRRSQIVSKGTLPPP